MANPEPPPLPATPPPLLPPALPPNSVGGTAPAKKERRWSRAALVGFLIVTTSAGLLIVFLANLLGPLFTGRMGPINDPAAALQFFLPPLATSLGVGLIGTVLGWIGLVGIARRTGQRRGLLAGVLAALYWPLLLVGICGILLPAGFIGKALAENGRGEIVPPLMIGALSTAVLIHLLVAIGVARWAGAVRRVRLALKMPVNPATESPGSIPGLPDLGGHRPIRHKPLLAGLATVAYISLSVFLAIRMVHDRVEQAQRAMQPPGWMPPQQQAIDPTPNVQPNPRLSPIPEVPAVQPGETSHSRYRLLTPGANWAELRVTFWSNGLPVDLPTLQVRETTPPPSDAGQEYEWELQRDANGTHYTLSGSAVSADGNADATAKPKALVQFDLPAEVELMPVAGTTPVRPRDFGPARRWVFLSLDDARAGRRLNADWGVSFDYYARPATAAR